MSFRYHDRDNLGRLDKPWPEDEKKSVPLDIINRMKEDMYKHMLYNDIEESEKVLEERGYIVDRKTFKGTAEEYLKYIDELRENYLTIDRYKSLKSYSKTKLEPKKSKDVL